MSRQRLYAFIIIFGWLLSACAPRGNASVADALAAELPAAAQESGPTAPAEQPVKKAPAAAGDLAEAPHAPPKTCPVTAPADPLFVPPEPFPSLTPQVHFWHGTSSLWTSLPQDGVWYGLPHNPEGYTQKVFWWSEGYFWADEPEPELVVTGERLDEPAPPLKVSRATNAFAKDIQSAMLVGVDFPTLGCWKISGQYGGAELRFVV